MLVISKSAEETKDIAKKFIKDLIPTSADKATIVELIGDLGAGKTTFMQGVGEFFGVKENLVSPTFVIQRNHEIPDGFLWQKLVHIDAYRIEDEKELHSIAFDRYASDPANIIFIEWPGNLGRDSGRSKCIEFVHINENEREIKI